MPISSAKISNDWYVVFDYDENQFKCLIVPDNPRHPCAYFEATAGLGMTQASTVVQTDALAVSAVNKLITDGRLTQAYQDSQVVEVDKTKALQRINEFYAKIESCQADADILNGLTTAQRNALIAEGAVLPTFPISIG